MPKQTYNTPFKMTLSKSLQFIPYSVIMRSKGFIRTRRGAWVVPAAPAPRALSSYPEPKEDHILSKPNAWFNESEVLRLAEEEDKRFYTSLSAWEWREVSLFRRGDFRSGLEWAEWCESIDRLRDPAPVKHTRSGVPEGKLMRLWRDYTAEPHLYFQSRAEQRKALDSLEYLISFSRDSVTLKKATKKRNAVRTIERAVTAWQMKRRAEREMEDMWDEYERASIESD